MLNEVDNAIIRFTNKVCSRNWQTISTFKSENHSSIEGPTTNRYISSLCASLRMYFKHELVNK